MNISEFYLGQTQVTQAQWASIMGNNPSSFKGAESVRWLNGMWKVVMGNDSSSFLGNDQFPVECVSWLDAMYFCQKLSQKTKRTYRLPSEAEWEYACRAGTTTPFAFGATITPTVVNYDGDEPYERASKGKSRYKTIPVGSFPPNLFGLYDLHGNVSEWCLDEWIDNYNSVLSDGSARENINSRDKNIHRTKRGGSFSRNASDCRSACRSAGYASLGSYHDGFRVVCQTLRTS